MTLASGIQLASALPLHLYHNSVLDRSESLHLDHTQTPTLPSLCYITLMQIDEKHSRSINVWVTAGGGRNIDGFAYQHQICAGPHQALPLFVYVCFDAHRIVWFWFQWWTTNNFSPVFKKDLSILDIAASVRVEKRRCPGQENGYRIWAVEMFHTLHLPA